MANALTTDQRQQLKDAFDVFDAGSGVHVLVRHTSRSRWIRKNIQDRTHACVQSVECQSE